MKVYVSRQPARIFLNEAGVLVTSEGLSANGRKFAFQAIKHVRIARRKPLARLLFRQKKYALEVISRAQPKPVTACETDDEGLFQRISKAMDEAASASGFGRRDG